MFATRTICLLALALSSLPAVPASVAQGRTLNVKGESTARVQPDSVRFVVEIRGRGDTRDSAMRQLLRADSLFTSHARSLLEKKAMGLQLFDVSLDYGLSHNCTDSIPVLARKRYLLETKRLSAIPKLTQNALLKIESGIHELKYFSTRADSLQRYNTKKAFAIAWRNAKELADMQRMFLGKTRRLYTETPDHFAEDWQGRSFANWVRGPDASAITDTTLQAFFQPEPLVFHSQVFLTVDLLDPAEDGGSREVSTGPAEAGQDASVEAE